MLDATPDYPIAATPRKVARLLGDLETYVSGRSDIIIDYATTRRREEPILANSFSDISEVTVQRRITDERLLEVDQHGLVTGALEPLHRILWSGFWSPACQDDMAGPSPGEPMLSVMRRDDMLRRRRRQHRQTRPMGQA
jgi:hypothetical protein